MSVLLRTYLSTLVQILALVYEVVTVSECCTFVAPPAGHWIIFFGWVKPIKMHVAKLSDGGHPVC